MIDIKNRPFSETLRTGSIISKGSLFLVPGNLPENTILTLQHQQEAALPKLRSLCDAANEVLRKLSIGELAKREVVLTAHIHYRLPDYPAIVCPNDFTTQMADYAVTLPKANEDERKVRVVYPYYYGFLAWWVENIEGIIQNAKCAVQSPTHPTLKPIGRRSGLILTAEGTA